MTTSFTQRSNLPCSAERLFDWHVAPGALARLTPPWERVRVVDAGPGVANGTRATIAVKAGPLWKRWVAEHRDVVPGRGFTDVQIEGPFAAWTHHHRFEPAEPNASTLEDAIEYTLPLGALGRLVAGGAIQTKLQRMFAYRHGTTALDLAAHARYGPERPWRILMSGATGLVGRALTAFLTTGGHEVVPLARGVDLPDRPTWDPAAQRIDLSAAGPLDAIVHLAGENVGSGRWTSARRERIRASRDAGTRLLADAVARLDVPPRVWVQASATGIYGDRGDEILTEDSKPGEGFLAEVAGAWEAAAAPARAAGLRTVALRFGVVLDPRGGALARLLPPTRLGVGGPVGSGRQYWPWIAIDDVLDLVLRALTDNTLDGAVNAVAPEAATSRDLAKALGRVLRRPAFVPLPAWAVRAAFGEMGQALLLASQRVVPARLTALDHPFRHPTLEGALRHLLGRTKEF